jgi:hypothetical protein
MGTKGFPPEFRRRVLDLGDEGRRVAEEAAANLQIEQTISTWHRQALPGKTELG